VKPGILKKPGFLDIAACKMFFAPVKNPIFSKVPETRFFEKSQKPGFLKKPGFLIGLKNRVS
jgi:hypothetical protein